MSLYHHLEKLRYFVAIADSGSFKHAADKLHLTQPTLSKSMRTLEDALETELFVRHARGVELTTEGQYLYQECLGLFEKLDGIGQSLMGSIDPLAQKIRIGTFDSIAIYLLAAFLRGFLKKWPTLKIDLMTDRSFDIQRKLEQGELDLAIIVNPKDNAQLQVIKLFDDCFRLYQSQSHQNLYSSAQAKPIVVMKGILSEKDEKFLQEKSQQSLLYVSSLETAKELCLQGVGYALLPEHVASSALSQKKIELASKLAVLSQRKYSPHTVSLCYSKRVGHSETLNHFVAELRLAVSKYE